MTYLLSIPAPYGLLRAYANRSESLRQCEGSGAAVFLRRPPGTRLGDVRKVVPIRVRLRHPRAPRDRVARRAVGTDPRLRDRARDRSGDLDAAGDEANPPARLRARRGRPGSPRGGSAREAERQCRASLGRGLASPMAFEADPDESRRDDTATEPPADEPPAPEHDDGEES